MMIQKLDILSVELVNGELRCQLGDSAREEGRFSDATWWGLDGFYSRPKPPDEDGACMALYVGSNSARRIFASKDNRVIEKYGELGEGDKAIVGYGDARFIMKDASDSISLMTKNHAANDELMIQQLNGQKGEFTILLGGTDGTTIIKAKSGVIHFGVAGGGSLTIDKDGVHVTGNVFNAACANGNLGLVGNAIPPPPGVNSILKGVAGNIGTPSTGWTVF